MKRSTTPVAERFYTKVNFVGACWIWVGGLYSNGYGKFFASGKYRLAHRWAYENFKSKIPSDILVCHKCDNKNCVNPDHLFLGTQSDNMRDAVSKKRLTQQKRTHCPSGHEYDYKNTLWVTATKRSCKKCRRLNNTEYCRRARAKRRQNEARIRLKTQTPPSSL